MISHKFYPRKPVVLLIIILLSSFINISYASDDLEEVTLQLRWYHQFQFAGYYAALEKGYYRDAGLKVNIAEGGIFDTVEKVVSSEAEYGASNSEIVIHRLEGKPVVVLAVIFQHSAHVLMAIEGSGINSPQDLFDKKIWIPSRVRNAELFAMIANEGVSLSQIENIYENTPKINYVDPDAHVYSGYLTNEPFI
ncbi:GGDEF domain-containing protein, partial [Candidatus Poribacteria bacterium]|nr:GGDEF domain-containing protein [Candidatus Poribacteria bacterium]